MYGIDSLFQKKKLANAFTVHAIEQHPCNSVQNIPSVYMMNPSK